MQEPERPHGYNRNLITIYHGRTIYSCEHTFHIRKFEPYLKELAQMGYVEFYWDIRMKIERSEKRYRETQKNRPKNDNQER